MSPGAHAVSKDARRIPLWVDLRDIPVNKRLPYWRAVERVGAEQVLLGTDDPHLGRDGASTLRIDGNNAIKPATGTDLLGRLIILKGAKDQERAAELEGIALIDGDDWTIIPLENLIAARRDQPGTLFALARTVDDVKVYRDTLEIGVHGIALAPTDPDAIDAAHDFLVERGPRDDDRTDSAGTLGDAVTESEQRGGASKPTDFLVSATITAVEDAGPGDRVCVDTTSVFRDGEGLLIGSTARSFALIHAETLESEYVAPRPFRVNAGAVHSYLCVAGEKTRYLSELKAGSNVLAVHPDGVHRVLTVGRAKIERRPHTLLRWKTDAEQGGQDGHAILQTAETIRLVRPDGSAIAITELSTGDKILVHNETAARHFGMPVEEQLEER